jgi:hypothetical protein
VGVEVEVEVEAEQHSYPQVGRQRYPQVRVKVEAVVQRHHMPEFSR